MRCSNVSLIYIYEDWKTVVEDKQWFIYAILDKPICILHIVSKFVANSWSQKSVEIKILKFYIT